MATRKEPEAGWPEAKGLFHELLDYFYDDFRPTKAYPVALKLQRLLDRLDPAAESLPGNEYRAVIAELDGDLPAAIRHREWVVEQMERLHATGQLASAHLAPDDLSDQLDLLASCLLEAGRVRDAKRAITRSERLCREADIPFDGEDIKADILQAGSRRKAAVVR